MGEFLILSIIYVTNSILYFVIFYLMINKLREKKQLRNRKEHILVYTLIILILLLPKFEVIKIYYCALQGVILALLCKSLFEISKKDSLIYGMVFSLGYIIIENIVSYFLLKALFEFIIAYTPLKYKLAKYLIVNTILIIFIKNFKKIINLDINKKYYMYIGLTIIINGISIFFIIVGGNLILDLYSIIAKDLSNYTSYEVNFGLANFINIIQNIVPIIMIFCNIFLVIVINNLIKSMKSKSELKAINDKLDMQYNYYLNIQESQMKVRKLYHDINNHMACINQIENEDINEYIDSIKKELKDFDNAFDSGNRILDIILSDKQSECMKNNIDFFCDINFEKCDFVEMIDVSAIFANMIDNAIEACKKVENDRYINLRGTIVKSYYVIKCENSKSNEIKMKNNRIISSKKDSFLHGIGLSSIKESLKKYDGDMETIDEKNKFTLKIYIPLRTN
ncbi:GHKL domain-containing protein [Terrisporobacter glycolicus]|uniref:Sensor histidine kinase NatK-like C-terminal domain-containing protein n=2 Tax=Terrisporobacter glycolicus TaxID=36841 RepID=A0ABZ2EWK3_9FIRM